MSFNFGAQNTQQKPTLGVQPLSFSAGTNVAAVAPQSAPAFGAPAATTSTFGFGATTTTSAAPLTFGAQPAAAATPAPAAASTGFSFGGQPQASTAAATPGFSLGQPKVKITSVRLRNDICSINFLKDIILQ